MQPALEQALRAELALARMNEEVGQLERALHHLARAHVLSQRFAIAHTAVHLHMLRLGIRRRRPREIWGQLGRALAALVFSRIWVPLGNTGLADVSAFKPMPVPADLAPLLQAQSPAER